MSNPVQPSVCAEIPSARLDLVAVTPASIACQVGFTSDMYPALSRILRAEIPAAWPLEHWEPHVLDYLLKLFAEHPESVGWCRYLLLREPDRRTLIGSFGCGLPKPGSGDAELGYGILPAWQRQGFAAEAVEAMMPWLAQQQPIRAFIAHTYPHLRGSVRVLEKCGFVLVDEEKEASTGESSGSEEQTVLYRRSLAPTGTPAEGAIESTRDG